MFTLNYVIDTLQPQFNPIEYYLNEMTNLKQTRLALLRVRKKKKVKNS